MKQIIVLLAVLFLTACTAGMYTGGGWTEDDFADPEGVETHPSFGFSVDTCHEQTEGVFTFFDAGWERHPVHITGHILDFGDLEGAFDTKVLETDCNYFALMDYTSLDMDEDYQGEGHAIACFTDDEKHVLISIQSGPYEGYEKVGAVHGVMVHHDCE